MAFNDTEGFANPRDHHIVHLIFPNRRCRLHSSPCRSINSKGAARDWGIDNDKSVSQSHRRSFLLCRNTPPPSSHLYAEDRSSAISDDRACSEDRITMFGIAMMMMLARCGGGQKCGREVSRIRQERSGQSNRPTQPNNSPVHCIVKEGRST